jgi:hypothetical protein
MAEPKPDKAPETITTTVKERIFHSGVIYAEGSEITDTPESLLSALETKKVVEKKGK